MALSEDKKGYSLELVIIIWLTQNQAVWKHSWNLLSVGYQVPLTRRAEAGILRCRELGRSATQIDFPTKFQSFFLAF